MTPGEPFLNLEMLLLITGRQSSVDSGYMSSSKTQCEDIKKNVKVRIPIHENLETPHVLSTVAL